jgi:hypothetical protein
MRKMTKRIAVVATAVLLTAGAGVAYAAWSVSGTGTAATKASSASALTTLDTSADVEGQLYPGGNGDLVLKISNPNKFPVKVTTVTLKDADITSDKAGCSGAATGLTVTLPSTVDIAIGAEASASHTFVGAVSMSNASVDNCQGATFAVPLNLYGESNAAA